MISPYMERATVPESPSPYPTTGKTNNVLSLDNNSSTNNANTTSTTLPQTGKSVSTTKTR